MGHVIDTSYEYNSLIVIMDMTHIVYKYLLLLLKIVGVTLTNSSVFITLYMQYLYSMEFYYFQFDCVYKFVYALCIFKEQLHAVMVFSLFFTE